MTPQPGREGDFIRATRRGQMQLALVVGLTLAFRGLVQFAVIPGTAISRKIRKLVAARLLNKGAGERYNGRIRG